MCGIIGTPVRLKTVFALKFMHSIGVDGAVRNVSVFSCVAGAIVHGNGHT